MPDNDNSIITFGIGLLVGGLFTYLIFKSIRQSQPATVSMSQPQQLPPQYMQPMFIPVPTYAPPQYPSVQQLPYPPVPPLHQMPATVAAPVQHVQAKSGLQNEEEWVVKKDKKGRLEGITVHRKVTPVG